MWSVRPFNAPRATAPDERVAEAVAAPLDATAGRRPTTLRVELERFCGRLAAAVARTAGVTDWATRPLWTGSRYEGCPNEEKRGPTPAKFGTPPATCIPPKPTPPPRLPAPPPTCPTAKAPPRKPPPWKPPPPPKPPPLKPPPPNPPPPPRAHAASLSATTRRRLTKPNTVFVFMSHVPSPAFRCHCASARFFDATEELLFAPSLE